MDEPKRSPWAAWCVAIVVFLTAYVGSYAMLRQPVPPGYGSMLVVRSTVILKSGANYRLGGFAAKVFFMPLEALDDIVRPNAWVEW